MSSILPGDYSMDFFNTSFNSSLQHQPHSTLAASNTTNIALRLRITELEAENRTLQSNMASILEVIGTLRAPDPTASSSSASSLGTVPCPPGHIIYFSDNSGNILTAPKMVKLSRADYPSVKFWKKSDFYSTETDIDKQKQKLAKQRGQMYMELDDGTIISDETAADLRRFIRQLYHHLKVKNMAPPTWGQAPNGVHDWFYASLEDKYPFVRLCHEHWKAHEVPLLAYPSWSDTHVKNKSVRGR
ncbi:hypothetical protein HDZ31DRAFT_70951 [Schizophyllum fasciatum]